MKYSLIICMLIIQTMQAQNIFVEDFGHYKIYTNAEQNKYKIKDAKTNKTVLENLTYASAIEYFIGIRTDGSWDKKYLDHQLEEYNGRSASAFGENIIYTKNDKTFKIINKNKKVVYDDLKFMGWISSEPYTYQILDQNNNLFYLNENLEKFSTLDSNHFLRGFCGNVASFSVKIIKENNTYCIEKTTDISLVSTPEETNTVSTKIIDSFPIDRIKKLYFVNGEKTLRYSENDFITDFIILEYDDKIGIRENSKTNYFDALEYLKDNKIKVKKNGFYGIYNQIETKYKRLDDFIFYLAKITTTNNKTGYIDGFGNEYL